MYLHVSLILFTEVGVSVSVQGVIQDFLGGTKLFFGLIFADNCRKMEKKLDWGSASIAPRFATADTVQSHQTTSNLSGGSRISPRRGRQLPGGRQHTILPKFPKNCMKLKEFGPPGGRASLSPPLDPRLNPGFEESKLGRYSIRSGGSCDLYKVLISLLFYTEVAGNSRIGLRSV